jgi:hypothetical protein
MMTSTARGPGGRGRGGNGGSLGDYLLAHSSLMARPAPSQGGRDPIHGMAERRGVPQGAIDDFVRAVREMRADDE